MESLFDFALQGRYKKVKDLGDRLSELATLIEWEPFREIVGDLYTNTTDQGGRPNIDVVLMINYWYFNRCTGYPIRNLNARQMTRSRF